MLRHLVCFITVIIAMSCAPVFGQTPMPGWDRNDPVNQAETQQFLASWWHMQNTGVDDPTLDDFVFTNPLPDVMTTLVLPAIEVFNELYRDQLNYTGQNGEFYTLFDLMDDDPLVAARFQSFTLTRVLVTTAMDDPGVIQRHLAMVIDAVTTQEEFTVESFMLDGLSIESVRLVRTTSISPWVDPLPPIVVPAPLQQFDCDLREWVKRSLLACMASKGLYLKDGKKTGRFDCDDFADALASWLKETLKKKYPNVKVYAFLYWWQCPKLDENGNPVLDGNGDPVYEDVPGHAMVLIEIDGQYYLVEPQTGQIIGPFSNSDEAYRRAMEMAPPSCAGWRRSPSLPIPHDPHRRTPVEPKPWWEYEDMQQRFCQKLRECCNELGTWPAPAAGCGPTSLPDGTTPGNISPCDSVPRYAPGGTWISPNACP